MADKLPAIPPDDLITIDAFQRALPGDLKKRVNQAMVDDLNKLLHDPMLRENFRDNLLGYTGVMRDGKFKIQSYLDAVKYVSYKLLGSTNIEAYAKTFPQRYQRLINEGADDRTISSYCAAYNKTVLVNKILEQTLVPVHVLNSDLYQKALNTQATLMITAKSEKVRSDAADSVMRQLRPPEAAKIELDVTHKEDKSVQALRETTLKLVNAQRELLEKGASAQDIAHSKLDFGENAVDGEFEEVKEE